MHKAGWLQKGIMVDVDKPNTEREHSDKQVVDLLNLLHHRLRTTLPVVVCFSQFLFQLINLLLKDVQSNQIKSIKHEPEVITIDDDTYDGQEPTDPQDRIVVDTTDNLPVSEDILLVPEDFPAAAKDSVETEDHDPGNLWKKWAKNQDNQREETLLTVDQHWSNPSKTDTKELKVKTKRLEINQELEPKKTRYIETVNHDNGTIF
jgi:hypothetical protein